MDRINLILLPAGAVAQSWLAVILLRRGLHREFRFFFSYTVFAVLAAIIKFAAVLISYRAYFFVYWTTEALYALLGLLAILEVFPIVFKTFSLLWQYRLMIWGVVTLMLVISVLQAIFRPPIEASPGLALIYSFEISIRYLQGGVFLLFILLLKFWQIEWRQYVYGILLGFGVMAVGNLGPGMLRSEYGTKFTNVFRFVPAVAYMVAVFIWLLAFIRREAPDPMEEVRSPLRPTELVHWLRRLTDSIKEYRR